MSDLSLRKINLQMAPDLWARVKAHSKTSGLKMQKIAELAFTAYLRGKA